MIEAASGAGVAAAMSDRLRHMDPALKNIAIALNFNHADVFLVLKKPGKYKKIYNLFKIYLGHWINAQDKF